MKIKAIELKKYFLYFLMYSMIGWLSEILLVLIKRHEYSNRGVLFGPYCPVYGVGAILFIILIYHLIKDKSLKRKILMIPVVFILSAIIATIIELIASYLCEFITGSWSWDYSKYKYDFQGRIALFPSTIFGLGGVLFLYILQPLFEKIIKKLGNKKVNRIFNITVIIFVIDAICFIIKSIIS